LLHIRVTVLSPPEMDIRSDPKHQKRHIGRDSTTIKLVRVELLLVLYRREPSVLPSVVNVSCASQRIVSQQIRSWLVFTNKLAKVDSSTALLERRLKRYVVLGGYVQKLTKVKFIQSSGCGPKLRTSNHCGTRKRRNKLHRNVLDRVGIIQKRQARKLSSN
jgi:hypothetical protein